MQSERQNRRSGCRRQAGGCLLVLLVAIIVGLATPELFFWTPVFLPLKTASGAIRDLVRPPQWVTILSVTTPRDDTVELREKRFGSGNRAYVWRWTAPHGEPHEFPLGVALWREGTVFYQFRASPDYQRMWLIFGDPPGYLTRYRYVSAALDVRSGQFFRNFNPEKKAPAWATLHGGIVLGQCEMMLDLETGKWRWKASGAPAPGP